MNKHLPVLIVLLGFGLVGCATPIQVSHPSEALSFVHEQVGGYLYLDSPKAQAINLKTGEKFHVANYRGSELTLKSSVVTWCSVVFNSECVLSRFNDEVYYRDVQDYRTQVSNKKQSDIRYAENQARIRKEWEENSKRMAEEQLQRKLNQEQEEKQTLIASLTKRCEDYGFTGDNNIAACIQREAQHDKELEMQKWELEKTRIALQQAQSRTYVQQQPEEEEVPMLIQMLGDIAVGVAEGYKNQQIYQQPQQKQSIYRNCKPNC